MAEFPLTIGVIGVVLAPVFAAVGALAALLTDCTIEVERVEAKQPRLVEPNGESVPLLWTGVGIEELLPPLVEPKAATLVTNGKAIEDETTA